jgi:SAM-dependent methyltransferase
MKCQDLNLLCCPGCRRELTLHAEDGTSEGTIDAGHLSCTACGAHYPVRGGIPRFCGADNYAASFGMQWQRYRRTQLDSYTGKSISRDRLAVATGWPRSLAGERILEAGSGAGRFSERLLECGAQLVSFDYSGAVEANFANNGAHPNLTLFQGDIFAIPCPERSFDRVICLGVLQHTPDPQRAFSSLARQVRPGGFLAIDVYPRRLSALLHWKYVLRPLTKRMSHERLHRLVSGAVDALLPVAVRLRAVGGRVGSRLIPIVEYSELQLSPELHREWSVLDTFDMYSPAHDHPQSIRSVRSWFAAAGFADIEVFAGPNGVVGRGRNAATAA